MTAVRMAFLSPIKVAHNAAGRIHAMPRAVRSSSVAWIAGERPEIDSKSVAVARVREGPRTLYDVPAPAYRVTKFGRATACGRFPSGGSSLISAQNAGMNRPPTIGAVGLENAWWGHPRSVEKETHTCTF